MNELTTLEYLELLLYFIDEQGLYNELVKFAEDQGYTEEQLEESDPR